jgi:hypothetical protein
MNMTLSVADASLKSDGETATIVLYDGKRFDVPIKNISWHTTIKDKCMVDTIDEQGRPRRFLFDFSKVRPQQLIDRELCMAIVHPDVHRITWNV